MRPFSSTMSHPVAEALSGPEPQYPQCNTIYYCSAHFAIMFITALPTVQCLLLYYLLWNCHCTSHWAMLHITVQPPVQYYLLLHHPLHNAIYYCTTDCVILFITVQTTIWDYVSLCHPLWYCVYLYNLLCNTVYHHTEYCVRLCFTVQLTLSYNLLCNTIYCRAVTTGFHAVLSLTLSALLQFIVII